MLSPVEGDIMGEPSASGSPPSDLSEKLNQRLNMYALAASAAGVGLLALAKPVEARVIYTKTHKVIGLNSLYGLDLNHDGTVDFLIEQWRRISGSTNALLVKEAYGNAVQGYGVASYYGRYASALRQGARIGPSQRFVRSGSPGEIMIRYYQGESGWRTGGQWKNIANRYLGLKFKIDGKTHYGWARLNVQMKGYNIVATLTGYAYETNPNKSIGAGQTGARAGDSTASLDLRSPENPQATVSTAKSMSAFLQPAGLGRLAVGAQGAPLRRLP
jgi:hypothetical protein